MASEDVQTNIRLPAGLKEQLQASAEKSARSLSAEIAFRVQQGFELEHRLLEAMARYESAMRDLGMAEERRAEAEAHAKSLFLELSLAKERAKVAQELHDDLSKKIGELRSENEQIRMSNIGPDERILIGSLKVQQRYIRVLGMYLKELARRVPPTDDQMTRKLLTVLISMGDQLDEHAGHTGHAAYELGQLHELGLPVDVFLGTSSVSGDVAAGVLPKSRVSRPKAKKPKS